MEFSKQGHCVYYTRYHIVMITKYRRRVLKAGMGEYLKATIRGISKHYPEIRIVEVNTDEDHVHIQIEIAPNVAVSEAVGRLKAYSSRHLRQRFKFIREIYLERDGIWSAGYFSSTVGLNEAQVRHYINWQGKKDKPQKSRLF